MTESSLPRSRLPGLAPFAADAAASRGRLHPESSSATRSAFQRDRDRVIHCGAFRRLALKTQVFLPEASDQYRTRLTHTIEVAQIARTISRALGLDDDLTEALALAHDLGHAPFGHTGEEALDRVVDAAGGFEHNAQTLAVVTRLERRYPGFGGLNLTWETLEGLVKRAGPPFGRPRKRPMRACMTAMILGLDAALGLDLDGFASAEAQAAATADDIAYNAHDLEDGLDAGLFGLADLRNVPLLEETLDRIATEVDDKDPHLVVRALTRHMVGLFVEDAIAESRRRLDEARPADADAVRKLGAPVIGLSPGLAQSSRAVKAFLGESMYRHPRLTRVRDQAFAVVSDLAARFVADPASLPAAALPAGAGLAAGSPGLMRLVADTVAGMTDRGALEEHRRLFPNTPDLR